MAVITISPTLHSKTNHNRHDNKHYHSPFLSLEGDVESLQLEVFEV